MSKIKLTSHLTADSQKPSGRRKTGSCLLLIFVTLGLLLPVQHSSATGTGQSGSTDLEGELVGAPYKIRMPVNWNGTLLIYAHGYRDKADHPGEVDDRSAQAAPGGAPAEQFLLAQGFALAGSAYSDNGWVVKEGIKDIRRLTNFFTERFGQPRRTILMGFSMGTVIALRSVEQYKKLYDGVICACGLGAGASLNFDLTVADFGLAYDVAFGWPASWGSPANIREDLDFETEVLPVVISQLQNPANLGRFEFLRLVTDTPMLKFYPAEGNPLPNLFVRMFFATEAAAELQRRAGGRFAQNLDHQYRLADEKKGYLTSLNLNADNLLATMNARRNLSAQKSARNFAEQYADYTGNIKRPVLAIHNQFDGLAHPGNISVYETLLKSAGREDLFVKTFVNSGGHCEFTPEQLFSAIAAMQLWLETGVKPGATAFPETLGFINDITVPVWPQPFQLPAN